MTSDVKERIGGSREIHAVGEETSYGSFNALEETFGRNSQFQPNDKENVQEILASGRDNIARKLEQGLKIRRFTHQFTPQNWRHLKYVFGNGSSDVTDADQGSYFSHDFALSSVAASASYDRYFPHSSNEYGVRYLGCQAQSYNLSWEAAQGEDAALVTAALEMLAEDTTKIGSSSPIGQGNHPSPPSSDAFQFRNVILTFNGSEVIDLIGGNVNVALNLNDARYANYNNINRTKASSNRQKRVVSGTFRVHYSDSSYFDQFDPGQVVPGTNQVTLKRGTNDLLDIPLKNFRITGLSDNTQLGGNNESQIEWEADDVQNVHAEDQISSY